jgi:F-type H+-transporting ATPase subunit b
MNLEFIQIARAEGNTESVTEAGQTKSAEEHSGGLSLDPMVVGFQVFNFLVLLLVLKWILYKPLMKLLSDREHQIKKGVENAENAEMLLKESEATHEKMLKEARAEGQSMVEAARKSGEQVRTDIVAKAQEEAQHIITSGKELVDAEKAKALQEVKAEAVEMVLKATEKLLKQKIDAAKDAKLIEDSIQSYAK